jgi:hypothetical protein
MGSIPKAPKLKKEGGISKPKVYKRTAEQNQHVCRDQHDEEHQEHGHNVAVQAVDDVREVGLGALEPVPEGSAWKCEFFLKKNRSRRIDNKLGLLFLFISFFKSTPWLTHEGLGLAEEGDVVHADHFVPGMGKWMKWRQMPFKFKLINLKSLLALDFYMWFYRIYLIWFASFKASQAKMRCVNMAGKRLNKWVLLRMPLNEWMGMTHRFLDQSPCWCWSKPTAVESEACGCFRLLLLYI